MVNHLKRKISLEMFFIVIQNPVFQTDFPIDLKENQNKFQSGK